MGDEVVPDGLENGEEGFVSGLGIKIGCAGLEIGGADGVANHVALFFQGDAVLVVVVAIWHEVAHGEKFDGEMEIARVARGAI